MAKSWSQVETSQGYQALSLQERRRAKQEYWNTVVMPKPEFKGLTGAEKNIARQEFLGMPLGASSVSPQLSPLETRIARRPDLLAQARQTAGTALGQIRQHPFRSAIGLEPAAGVGMSFLQGAGGLLQRGQAAIAAPLMELQKGVVSPAKLGQAALKGVTGERLAELGDIPRQIGWPEPIAATIGFFSTMGLGNLATQGRLVTSARKATQFASSKLPKVMSKNYLINRSKLAGSGVEDLHAGLSQQYDDIYNAIGNKRVNLVKVQEIADDLPQVILNKVNKSNLIQKLPDGSVAPTLNNMKVVKNILRKSVPKNVLSGRQQADIFQGNIKYNLERVKDVMAEGNPQLQALNQQYRQFMQLRAEIGDIIWDKFGNPKSSGLANLFKPGAERARQISFEKFSQLWPQATQIMRDSLKYSRRQTLKMWGRRGAMIGGGYELGRRALRPLVEGLTGGGGEYQGGGGY